MRSGSFFISKLGEIEDFDLPNTTIQLVRCAPAFAEAPRPGTNGPLPLQRAAGRWPPVEDTDQGLDSVPGQTRDDGSRTVPSNRR
jgi:hypothetical protein